MKRRAFPPSLSLSLSLSFSLSLSLSLSLSARKALFRRERVYSVPPGNKEK
jgi:hypothetical protein